MAVFTCTFKPTLLSDRIKNGSITCSWIKSKKEHVMQAVLHCLEFDQVWAGLHQAFHATVQHCPGSSDIKVLLQHDIHVAFVLEHLYHRPLQLCSKLLQHVVTNHEWDLVAQPLSGNLRWGIRRIGEERKGELCDEVWCPSEIQLTL